MSWKSQTLRDLVVERLAVAADEIFALFERTFAEFEEELVRSKRVQERAVVQPLPPPDVQPDPELSVEEQKPLVKKEVDLSVSSGGSVSCGVSPSPVKSEGTLHKLAFLQQDLVEETPEAKGEQCVGEEPGCSSDLLSDNNEQPFSCSDTDDSDDWRSAANREAKSDQQDPDLVLIEDSSTGRDDENALLSLANFSGSSNSMTDLQNQGLFNLPLSPLKTGHKLFGSSVDGRDFTQRAHLRSHLQTHGASEPFRCSVCSKEFSQRAHLKRHLQTHSAEKSFSCPECGLRLKQQHNMHRHISAVHRREKPFSCLFCQKAFAQKSDFIIHMRTHTGEKPFVCSFCRKGFRVRASLNKHVQKTHSTV